ncbi:MAG: radical SAM protein [bacterium]|nr:radical SAM protein [bacterium]
MSVQVPPGPPRVQIQTQAGCNARCVFCPNDSVLKSGLDHGRMPEELFDRIIGELAQTPPRRIGLYMMNEPLTDQRIADFVRLVTDRIPSTKSQLISNGTLLTEDCAEALIDAGLKQLKVSLQSLDPEMNRQIMGHSSERVIENCIAMQKLIKRKRAKRLDFRVSMVVTKLNEDSIPETRRFWERHGVRLVTSALENRGGNIDAAGDLNPHEMRTMGDCIRPSRDMMILFNGEVPLCCVDWHRTIILGDLSKQTVQEVWRGQQVQAIRDTLREGDVDRLPDICKNCTESACPDHHRRGLKGILSRLVGAR